MCVCVCLKFLYMFVCLSICLCVCVCVFDWANRWLGNVLGILKPWSGILNYGHKIGRLVACDFTLFYVPHFVA